MTKTSTGIRARVLCCTAQPHPEAMAALKAYAPQAEIIDVTDDKFGYWREISARWTGERDLVIVEQDIEIGENVIRSLEECDQDWCCFAYTIFRRKVRLRVGLGCTKISAAAQRKVSAREVSEGFALCKDCKGAGCWWHLDGRVSAMLKKAGYSPHVHGDVTHHHDYHAQAGEPVQGWPLEVFFEEDTDQTPARRIVNADPIGDLATTPRQAAVHAQEMAELAEAIVANPDRVAPQIALGDDDYPLLLDGAPVTLESGEPARVSPPRAFGTDKVGQGYMPVYYEIADYLGPSARVCEVGVFRGASLATWQELYPQGTIAGVDVNSQAYWPDGTLRVVMSQDDPALPEALSEYEVEWDLIVDDASHNGVLTAATLDLLWSLVSPGGFYVIEDWFVGFDDYRGPCKSPEMFTLVQSLLSRLHADGDVASIGYRYGMAIMRKKA